MKIKKTTYTNRGIIKLELIESFRIGSTINIYELKSSNFDVIGHRKRMMIDRFYDDILKLKGIDEVHKAIQRIKKVHFEKDKELQQYLISILSEIVRINDNRNYDIEIEEEDFIQ